MASCSKIGPSGSSPVQNSTGLARKQASLGAAMGKDFLFYFALLMTAGALLLNQAQALSLISEKCDPNKVGPDETTVKGGWQAEMFNGLSFRTCGKCS